MIVRIRVSDLNSISEASFLDMAAPHKWLSLGGATFKVSRMVSQCSSNRDGEDCGCPSNLRPLQAISLRAHRLRISLEYSYSLPTYQIFANTNDATGKKNLMASRFLCHIVQRLRQRPQRSSVPERSHLRQRTSQFQHFIPPEFTTNRAVYWVCSRSTELPKRTVCGSPPRPFHSPPV